MNPRAIWCQRESGRAVRVVDPMNAPSHWLKTVSPLLEYIELAVGFFDYEAIPLLHLSTSIKPADHKSRRLRQWVRGPKDRSRTRMDTASPPQPFGARCCRSPRTLSICSRALRRSSAISAASTCGSGSLEESSSESSFSQKMSRLHLSRATISP